MREVWGARAHNTHDASDGDTATVADDASLASQDDGRSTTLDASQALSTTMSTTDTNCIIGRTIDTAPGGGDRETAP
jgi:hypothetical protein